MKRLYQILIIAALAFGLSGCYTEMQTIRLNNGFDSYGNGGYAPSSQDTSYASGYRDGYYDGSNYNRYFRNYHQYRLWTSMNYDFYSPFYNPYNYGFYGNWMYDDGYNPYYYNPGFSFGASFAWGYPNYWGSPWWGSPWYNSAYGGFYNPWFYSGYYGGNYPWYSYNYYYVKPHKPANYRYGPRGSGVYRDSGSGSRAYVGNPGAERRSSRSGYSRYSGNSRGGSYNTPSSTRQPRGSGVSRSDRSGGGSITRNNEPRSSGSGGGASNNGGRRGSRGHYYQSVYNYTPRSNQSNRNSASNRIHSSRRTNRSHYNNSRRVQNEYRSWRRAMDRLIRQRARNTRLDNRNNRGSRQNRQVRNVRSNKRNNYFDFRKYIRNQERSYRQNTYSNHYQVQPRNNWRQSYNVYSGNNNRAVHVSNPSSRPRRH